jgi:hypothetical protein
MELVGAWMDSKMWSKNGSGARRPVGFCSRALQELSIAQEESTKITLRVVLPFSDLVSIFSLV